MFPGLLNKLKNNLSARISSDMSFLPLGAERHVPVTKLEALFECMPLILCWTVLKQLQGDFHVINSNLKIVKMFIKN